MAKSAGLHTFKTLDILFFSKLYVAKKKKNLNIKKQLDGHSAKVLRKIFPSN